MVDLVSFCFCVVLFFVGYELVGIFMNGSIQSGVEQLVRSSLLDVN
jgi:hypothetical protein